MFKEVAFPTRSVEKKIQDYYSQGNGQIQYDGKGMK